MVNIKEIRENLEKLKEKDKADFLKNELNKTKDEKLKREILSLLKELEQEGLEELVEEEDVKTTKIPGVDVNLEPALESVREPIRRRETTELPLGETPKLNYNEGKARTSPYVTDEASSLISVYETYRENIDRFASKMERLEVVTDRGRSNITLLNVNENLDKYVEVREAAKRNPASMDVEMIDFKKYEREERPSFEVSNILRKHDKELDEYKSRAKGAERR